MRRAPIALAFAVVVVTGCDDADSIPVQPSRTASALTLSAFPTTVLRSGSDVQVSARVTDAQGGLIEGTAVTFTTSSGALSTSSATTSSSGTATATLSANDAARVTASLPSGASAAIDLPAVSPFTVTIDRPSTVLAAGATFTVQVTPNSGVVSPPAPAVVTINCGFGSTVDITATRSHQCVFPSAGDFTVQATAQTANGWTTSESVRVSATSSGTPSSPSPTATVSVTGIELGRNDGSSWWRFTATSTVSMRQFEFDFGDGNSGTKLTDTTNLTTATEQHIYAEGRGLGKSSSECPRDATNANAFDCTVKVTGTPVNGSAASATLKIRVEVD